MSDGILGSAFAMRGTQPAWHVKGDLLGDAELTAVQALKHIKGDYEVSKLPIPVTLNGKTMHSGQNFVIRGESAHDDKGEIILGTNTVSDDWELITPIEAMELFDSAVPYPVDSIGVLRDGGSIFVSVRVPDADFDVAGQEHKMYILFSNAMIYGRKQYASFTPVQTVCMNTEQLAIEKAHRLLEIAHVKDSRRIIAEWLQETVASRMIVKEAYTEGFERLAKTPMDELTSKWVIDNVYPMPKLPRNTDKKAYKDIEARMERYDRDVKRVRKIRTIAKGFQYGNGLGSEGNESNDFGVYSAITELETYRKSKGEIFESMTTGARASRMRNAQRLALVANDLAGQVENVWDLSRKDRNSVGLASLEMVRS
jgi:hypothetical protein